VLDAGEPIFEAALGDFRPQAVFERLRKHLQLIPIEPVIGEDGLPHCGDHRPPGFHRPDPPKSGYRAAAVLIGLIAHEETVRVILTTRARGLKDHPGQVAFPGGKIEKDDRDPCAAALREAWEEIGLEARHVEPLGYLDPYLTGSGFLIYPVVAKVDCTAQLVPNPREVDEIFEVPLAFLMNAGLHELRSREANGISRQYYAMPYGRWLIWGATANIVRNFYERLYL